MVKQLSDNEIYLLIKYIQSVLWRVAKCLCYIEDAGCLKVKWRCLLRVLCPVRRPLTTSIVSYWRTRVWSFNSRACLWVLLRRRRLAKCWLSSQWIIFLLIFCLETPKDGSRPTNFWTEPSLASLLAISFPCTPACPGTQYSPTVCRALISFNTFWHCRINGDVLAARRASEPPGCWSKY
jgi:hypothetical protein